MLVTFTPLRSVHYKKNQTHACGVGVCCVVLCGFVKKTKTQETLEIV